MRGFFRSGEPFIWLAGSALALCLVMIGGLVVVVVRQRAGVLLAERSGASSSWPTVEVLLARTIDRQEIPGQPGAFRVQAKVGNRDLYGLDFRWIDEAANRPPGAAGGGRPSSSAGVG